MEKISLGEGAVGGGCVCGAGVGVGVGGERGEARLPKPSCIVL